MTFDDDVMVMMIIMIRMIIIIIMIRIMIIITISVITMVIIIIVIITMTAIIIINNNNDHNNNNNSYSHSNIITNQGVRPSNSPRIRPSPLACPAHCLLCLGLQGYYIGNGCTDDAYDGDAFVPFIAGHGLISSQLQKDILSACQGNYWNATGDCSSLLATAYDVTTHPQRHLRTSLPLTPLPPLVPPGGGRFEHL